MLKILLEIRNRRFTTLAVTMIVFGVVTGVALNWPSKAKSYLKAQAQPKVTSKTPAVRLVETSRTNLGNDSVLVVKLQNISSEEIRAYTIASGKAWVTKHYFFQEKAIAPNAIDTQIIPLSSGTHKGAFESGKEVSVAAVFFGNGTGDGDSLYVSMLSDEHAGIRDQANHMLPCLQKLSSTSTLEESTITACEAEARELPIKNTGRSADYEKGLAGAQREVLSQLNDVKEAIRSNSFSDAQNRKNKVTRIFQTLASSR